MERLYFNSAAISDMVGVFENKPSIVVVECNWRLGPRANRFSNAVHGLIGNGPDAPTAIKAAARAGQQEASVGDIFPIEVQDFFDVQLHGVITIASFSVQTKIPEQCALRALYGVHWLIYARPPNLNPNRPHCITGEEFSFV
jgi:hypothetical protein